MYSKSDGPRISNSFSKTRLELWAVNDYGWDVSENGSFDGLMGQLQRRDIDFAATGFFMRSDRMRVVDFTSETYHIR